MDFINSLENIFAHYEEMLVLRPRVKRVTSLDNILTEYQDKPIDEELFTQINKVYKQLIQYYHPDRWQNHLQGKDATGDIRQEIIDKIHIVSANINSEYNIIRGAKASLIGKKLYQDKPIVRVRTKEQEKKEQEAAYQAHKEHVEQASKELIEKFVQQYTSKLELDVDLSKLAMNEYFDVCIKNNIAGEDSRINNALLSYILEEVYSNNPEHMQDAIRTHLFNNIIYNFDRQYLDQADRLLRSQSAIKFEYGYRFEYTDYFSYVLRHIALDDATSYRIVQNLSLHHADIADYFLDKGYVVDINVDDTYNKTVTYESESNQLHEIVLSLGLYENSKTVLMDTYQRNRHLLQNLLMSGDRFFDKDVINLFNTLMVKDGSEHHEDVLALLDYGKQFDYTKLPKKTLKNMVIPDDLISYVAESMAYTMNIHSDFIDSIIDKRELTTAVLDVVYERYAKNSDITYLITRPYMQHYIHQFVRDGDMNQIARSLLDVNYRSVNILDVESFIEEFSGLLNYVAGNKDSVKNMPEYEGSILYYMLNKKSNGALDVVRDVHKLDDNYKVLVDNYNGGLERKSMIAQMIYKVKDVGIGNKQSHEILKIYLDSRLNDDSKIDRLQKQLSQYDNATKNIKVGGLGFGQIMAMYEQYSNSSNVNDGIIQSVSKEVRDDYDATRKKIRDYQAIMKFGLMSYGGEKIGKTIRGNRM